MKTPICVVGLLLLLNSPALAAETNPTDPLAENLFPPEFVMQHQFDIGLTDDQRSALTATTRQAQERFAGLQEQLPKEVEALGVLLQKQRIDQQAALAQLDKVLAREGEIKRAHLELVIGIKNKLTAEQQAKLQELKKQALQGPPASLRQKLQKVKAGVDDWQSSGRDPSPVGEIMQQFDPLMKEGRFKEAEEVLDRALKTLSGGQEQKRENKDAKPEK